jgi:hypothetical protein
MNLQSLYDIEEAITQHHKEVKAIHPYSHDDHPVELAYK